MKKQSILTHRLRHLTFVCLLLGTAGSATTALAQNAAKFLYLVPHGVSPNGKVALAGIETTNDEDQSEIGYFLTRFDGEGRAKIASERLFSKVERTPTENIVRNVWSEPAATESGGRQHQYVVSRYESDSRSQMAVLRLVNGTYVNQGYRQSSVDKALLSAIATRAEETDVEMDDTLHVEVGTSAVAGDDINNRNNVVDFDMQDVDLADGLYLTTWRSHVFHGKQDMELTIKARAVVRVTLNEEGDIVASKPKITVSADAVPMNEKDDGRGSGWDDDE